MEDFTPTEPKMKPAALEAGDIFAAVIVVKYTKIISDYLYYSQYICYNCTKFVLKKAINIPKFYIILLKPFYFFLKYVIIMKSAEFKFLSNCQFVYTNKFT